MRILLRDELKVRNVGFTLQECFIRLPLRGFQSLQSLEIAIKSGNTFYHVMPARGHYQGIARKKQVLGHGIQDGFDIIWRLHHSYPVFVQKGSQNAQELPVHLAEAVLYDLSLQLKRL